MKLLLHTFYTLLMFTFAFSQSLSADDWHRFLGPNANGTSNETGLLDNWDDLGPETKWETKLGTGYGAPSVLDGKLVVHHRVGKEEIILCLNAESGEEIWRYAYPSNFVDPYGYNNGPRASPYLTSDYCYTFGAEGKLTCVSVNGGALVWQRDVWKEWDVPEAFFGVGSSPVLFGDKLIVMTGGQPNAGISAFNPKTGETIWQSVGKDNWQGKPMTGWRGDRTVDWDTSWKIASYTTPVLTKIHGKDTIIALMRQGLVSVDPTNGEVNFSLWFRAENNESVNVMTPVVFDDHIFISNSYYRTGSVLIKVHEDGKGFEEVWRSDVLELHMNNPILLDGVLYGISGRNTSDAILRCVDFKTGEMLWQSDGENQGDDAGKRATSQDEINRRFGRGSGILADGKLIYTTEHGRLIMLKPIKEGYEEICRYRVPDYNYPCWAAPILSNGLLYLRNGEKLVCVSLRK
jgi:outer membrane protein assembly factor BamB